MLHIVPGLAHPAPLCPLWQLSGERRWLSCSGASGGLFSLWGRQLNRSCDTVGICEQYREGEWGLLRAAQNRPFLWCKNWGRQKWKGAVGRFRKTQELFLYPAPSWTVELAAGGRNLVWGLKASWINEWKKFSHQEHWNTMTAPLAQSAA